MSFAPLKDQPEEISLEAFLNPNYLGNSSIQNICNVFSDQSSIELQQFLKPEIYQTLLEELEALGAEEGAQREQPLWDELMGPCHVRRYSRVSNQNQNRIPGTLARIQKLFLSKVFEAYLNKIANLSFISAAPELRMFKKGDYTLLHDHALEKNGLDVVFSFPALPSERDQETALSSKSTTTMAEWQEEWGAGATHYVADKTNLLALYPKHNTLTMVLRDEGTLRFIRYLSTRVGDARRRELSVLYTVNEDGDDEGEDEDQSFGEEGNSEESLEMEQKNFNE
ncbi:Oxoglutarate/iron-dependent oxygenase, C-terminal degradation domain-containing protein [Lobosporangium transversale]|uniref:Oxoglutarate/iron-dependent oxygenase, C-terminal degradation domain-containing protein n=1 Tax=Lobosporangium transversale TaxID=64571 RepID=A0A1Y2GXS0_9FUNG|nr:Oxoglutarate/iron-dependent oxygenase, C-terminal degradation domain-containing protein [Lobosporangium transversale]ORZ27055.1 Oxoglutarate/iron-dependent oxygenase, C-terminal degradation domain-containing protein [Lobosporangium transversale]|eukprot:XP_021884802.1 Oxoglutarate/iron-dependent oxygenase, C-terminal degradation domain-containing protein [Lobosporangium transversale]